MKNIVIFGIRDNTARSLSVEIPAGITGRQLKNWKAKNAVKLADIAPASVSTETPVVMEVIESDLSDEPG